MMEQQAPQTVKPMELDALPGGHQSVHQALPQALIDCLRRAPRVLLIANNPAITQADFDQLAIGADDVVVSFNTCVKAPLLSAQSVNLFVHGFNAPDAYFFGLPPGPDVQRLIGQGGRCFTLLVGATGAMCPMPGVALFWERIPLPPLWHYPVDRPGGKRFVGPSTGFNALVLLDWLRGQGDYNYQLMTLGFSNEAGKLWSGHAWDYERQWLLQSDVITIPLLPRPWWQRWFRPR